MKDVESMSSKTWDGRGPSLSEIIEMMRSMCF
jgi:hypothetical protein